MYLYFSPDVWYQIIRGHFTSSNEVILEDLSLPGLAELKGRWRGSLDASGGGNGDTMVCNSQLIRQVHTSVSCLKNAVLNFKIDLV